VIGTVAAIFLLLFALGWLTGLIDDATGGHLAKIDRTSPSAQLVMCMIMSSIFRFVPFAIPAWYFVRLGRRSGLPGWSIVACSVLALLALFFISSIRPLDAGSELGKAGVHSTWFVGFRSKIGLDQIVQAVVPFAFSAWMLGRTFRWRSKILAT
jgi:hypothetical protein